MLAGLGGLIALAAIGLFAVVWFEGTHPWRGRADYVALGSSFGAGPGIFPREARSPLLCAQSQGNYAHLIARDAPHKAAAALRLDRFATGHVIDENGQGAQANLH